jgi:hypothetical protein
MPPLEYKTIMAKQDIDIDFCTFGMFIIGNQKLTLHLL